MPGIAAITTLGNSAMKLYLNQIHRISREEMRFMKMSEVKICDLKSKEAAKRLTKEATVMCSQCGVKAHDPKHLCEPIEMFDVCS
jgi:hypothetical protein